MPKKRVFIDSSDIIRGFLYKKSNSSIVIEMANRGDIVGVVNEKVVTEVLEVLKALKDKDFASLIFSLLYSSFEIVPKERYANEMEFENSKGAVGDGSRKIPFYAHAPLSLSQHCHLQLAIRRHNDVHMLKPCPRSGATIRNDSSVTTNWVYTHHCPETMICYH
jgi:hypothetical protein